MRALLSRLIVLAGILALTVAAGCGGGGGPAQVDAGDESTEPRDAILLPGAQLYPEGIAATSDGAMYVGSFREGTILRVEPGGEGPEATVFVEAAAGGLVSTVGLLAEQERGLLWVCSADPGVSTRTGEAAPSVRAFDLESGAMERSFDLPGGGFCNDMALDQAGNLYVTDSFAPRILVLPAGGDALEPWIEDEARFGGEGFNLNGIVAADDQIYTVKYNSGELFRIPVMGDGSAGAPVSIALDRALELPDGLKLERSGVLLVVEGVGRLTRITLDDDDRAEVTVVRDGLDGPTTVAVLGDEAWVAEGQLGHLFDSSLGDPDLPFQLVRVPLE